MAEAVVPDFLIAEAKQRRRRRRLGYLAALLVAGAAAGGWYGTQGGGSRAPATPSPGEIASARLRIESAARRAPIVESGLTGGIGWAMNGYALWISANGGHGWLTATPPHVQRIGDAVARISQVEFVDRTHGWVSAADVVGGPTIPAGSPSLRHMEIDRTTDGGRTWRWSVPPGCLDLCGVSSLSFLDARIGFALARRGRDGWLFRTADGGATWALLTKTHFAGSLTYLDAHRAVGIGVGGGLFSSRDGGRTWRRIGFAGALDRGQQPLAFGSTIVAPLFRGNRLVVAVSADAGTSWDVRAAPRGSSGLGAWSATGWIAGGQGGLHVTSDAGKTWRTVRPLDLPAGAAFWEVHFTSALAGWAIVAWKGLDGAVLVQTRDGGRWWTPLAPPVPKHP